MSQPSEPARPFSLARILMLVLPVAIVLIAAFVWSKQLVPTAQKQMSENVFARMLSTNAAAQNAPMSFADKNGDLVADSPEDPAECNSPDVLVFSFVAAENESAPEEAWKELLGALGDKAGRDVKYVHFSSVSDQMAALRNGEVHVVGLNTGVVPMAVERDGFVPLCTFGHEDGSYGYTMELLVPADSSLKGIKDLRGHKITFTRPDSNSGCKALLVLLKNDFDMRPDQDYQWGFSLGHEESIKGIANKELEAAPVASDILARMIEQQEISADAVRSIYTSERFPPATIGYVYNLAPELRDAIRETLVDYDLTGTGLEGQFGADIVKLVPVNYKDAWANARRINQVVADARAGS